MGKRSKAPRAYVGRKLKLLETHERLRPVFPLTDSSNASNTQNASNRKPSDNTFDALFHGLDDFNGRPQPEAFNIVKHLPENVNLSSDTSTPADLRKRLKPKRKRVKKKPKKKLFEIGPHSKEYSSVMYHELKIGSFHNSQKDRIELHSSASINAFTSFHKSQKMLSKLKSSTLMSKDNSERILSLKNTVQGPFAYSTPCRNAKFTPSKTTHSPDISFLSQKGTPEESEQHLPSPISSNLTDAPKNITSPIFSRKSQPENRNKDMAASEFPSENLSSLKNENSSPRIQIEAETNCKNAEIYNSESGTTQASSAFRSSPDIFESSLENKHSDESSFHISNSINNDNSAHLSNNISKRQQNAVVVLEKKLVSNVYKYDDNESKKSVSSIPSDKSEEQHSYEYVSKSDGTKKADSSNSTRKISSLLNSPNYNIDQNAPDICENEGFDKFYVSDKNAKENVTHSTTSDNEDIEKPSYSLITLNETVEQSHIDESICEHESFKKSNIIKETSIQNNSKISVIDGLQESLISSNSLSCIIEQTLPNLSKDNDSDKSKISFESCSDEMANKNNSVSSHLSVPPILHDDFERQVEEKLQLGEFFDSYEEYEKDNTLNINDIKENSKVCFDHTVDNKTIIVKSVEENNKKSFHSEEENNFSPYSDKSEEYDNVPSSLLPRRSTRLMNKNRNSQVPRRLSSIMFTGKRFERRLSICRHMSQNQLNLSVNSSAINNTTARSVLKGRKFSETVDQILNLQGAKDCAASSVADCTMSRRRSTIRIVNETFLQNRNMTLNQNMHRLSEESELAEFDDPGLAELSRLSLVEAAENAADGEAEVLRRCGQTAALPFDECYPGRSLEHCHKIGEGVFGEVFLRRSCAGRASGPTVMKVLPVAGELLVNGEPQKGFGEILSEVAIAQELSALRDGAVNSTESFVRVERVRCVRGAYPERLVDLWDLFDECKGSENDRPDFPPDQQYVVFELEYGGTPLESFNFVNAVQAHSVFLQIAFALAVAEEEFQFEHRDLHIGNVLISFTDDKSIDFVLRGSRHSVPTFGARATIIDYTLSRITLHQIGRTIYFDLANDEDQFTAHGDYQFDIYRLMREKNGNFWQSFEPFTNVLWLHYLLTKLIVFSSYEKKVKPHMLYMKKLKQIRNKILNYNSCVEYVVEEECKF